MARGKLLRPKSQVLLVHVAQGDNVFFGDAVEVGFAPAPRADEGDVQLVAGGVGAEEPGPRQDEPGGPGEGDGLKEVASFHGASLATRKRGVKPLPRTYTLWVDPPVAGAAPICRL